MRIMATTCPNQGHFYPTVPLLWALRSAGHDVLAVMPGDRFADLASSAGLPATSLPVGKIDFSHAKPEGESRATQDHTVEALVEHVLEYYVPLAERVVASTVEIAEQWRPDVVLYPPWEFAGPIAAACLGKPSVLHTWGVKPPPELDRPVALALAALHRSWGLEDDPEPWRWIDVCPPSLQQFPADSNAIPMTYVPYNGSRTIPPWLLEQPTAPRVCVTLGNIPILGDHATVLSQTLTALQAFDVETVVAASDNIALATELPPGTKLVRGLPLSQLLPSCDVVIHHGGGGSTMTSTVYGLPQLVLPQMCVQYQHAERIAATGAALRLDPHEMTVDSLREAIASLLHDPRPREVAEKLRAELASRPRPAEVAVTLEAIVTATRGVSPGAGAEHVVASRRAA
jgi:L-noviosyl transferase